MIQLYVKLADLTETESYEQVLAIAEYPDWKKSIRKYGIKYQLHVDYKGWIRDGNGRYWIGIDENYEYLPINPFFMFRLQYNTEVSMPQVPYFHVDPLIREYIENIAWSEQRDLNSLVKRFRRNNND